MEGYVRSGGGLVVKGGASGWLDGVVFGPVAVLFGWRHVLLWDKIVNRLFVHFWENNER